MWKDAFVKTKKLDVKRPNGLPKLRDLTHNLPSFPKETGQKFEGFKQHEMEHGTSLSWNLLNQSEISCGRWFLSAGSRFPIHVHNEREWLIIYKGSLFVKIGENDEYRLTPGMSCTIEPKIPHFSRTIEDCWYLAIVIPSSEDWPK